MTNNLRNQIEFSDRLTTSDHNWWNDETKLVKTFSHLETVSK